MPNDIARENETSNMKREISIWNGTLRRKQEGGGEITQYVVFRGFEKLAWELLHILLRAKAKDKYA